MPINEENEHLFMMLKCLTEAEGNILSCLIDKFVREGDRTASVSNQVSKVNKAW